MLLSLACCVHACVCVASIDQIPGQPHLFVCRAWRATHPRRDYRNTRGEVSWLINADDTSHAADLISAEIMEGSLKLVS
jgi:hypothetical protein